MIAIFAVTKKKKNTIFLCNWTENINKGKFRRERWNKEVIISRVFSPLVFLSREITGGKC